MQSSRSHNALAKLNILIVDDHEINREFLRAGLGRLARSVTLAAGGAEAVALCRAHDFDVILMDLHMPQMDGLATANRIRDLGTASSSARMIILTADTRPEEKVRLLDAGFDAFLNKPVSIHDLASTIELVLRPGGSGISGLGQSDGIVRLVDRRKALAAANQDDELVSQLTAMLVSELEQGLPRLDKMMKNGHFGKASGLLHQWAGAAGYAGASRFAQACRSLRRCLDQGFDSSPGTAYLDFLRVTHATRCALKTP